MFKIPPKSGPIFGMLADINAARTVAELQALATLEHEYPLVFGVQKVRDLFVKREQELQNA